MTWKPIKRWMLLGVLLLTLVLFFVFHLDRYLSFSTLHQHRQFFLTWTAEHYLLASLIYLLIYIIVVAVSLPGAALLTMVGGFLFGIVWGTFYVIISATLGATVIFLAVKFALEPWILKKTSRFMTNMRQGFQQNAFQYLLFLRLIPLFPFWVVNIVPAVLGVRLLTFITATFIGIIPGSLIYVVIGNSMGHILDQNQQPDFNIILTPYILFPLIGLALLSLLPILYKGLKKPDKKLY